MPNGVDDFTEILSAPMREVIASLGQGVSQAQVALDRQAIELQRQIDSDPELAEYGLRATWYQMPRTELELKVSVVMAQSAGTDRLGTDDDEESIETVYLQPVSAAFQNQFNYDAQASSVVKLVIVPVPPPGEPPNTPPHLSEDEALRIAAARLQTDENGRPRADLRLALNFNPRSRVWHVLQYRYREQEGALRVERIVQALVDDDTRSLIEPAG